jgi:hypothetical protein
MSADDNTSTKTTMLADDNTSTKTTMLADDKNQLTDTVNKGVTSKRKSNPISNTIASAKNYIAAKLGTEKVYDNRQHANPNSELTETDLKQHTEQQQKQNPYNPLNKLGGKRRRTNKRKQLSKSRKPKKQTGKTNKHKTQLSKSRKRKQ